MARDRFRDGAAILPTYEFAVGHEDEDPDQKSIPLERTAVTSGVGFVRQQGAPVPTVKKLKGWIKTADQLAKMEAYFNACAGIGTPSRTVFFRDISGGGTDYGFGPEYEVLITDFSPNRKRAQNSGLGWAWTYTITMEVIK